MTEPRVSFWRRIPRPRLSLRILMLAIVIGGVPCGLSIASARRQAGTVALIERLGGGVVYVPREKEEAKGIDEQPPPVTAWLINKLGQDAVENVTQVSLRDPSAGEPNRDEAEWIRINDDLANRLGELSHLEKLDIFKLPYFKDDHLARLAGLSRMRGLNLRDTALDGKSLRHLKEMKQLEHLDLHEIPIRDADLANLAGLTNLEFLSFSGNLITDDGLQHLASLKQLTTLNIRNTGRSPMAITSRGLVHLAGNSRLETLEIESSRIATVGPLRLLSELKTLSLMDASLTDQGLTALHQGFANLTNLSLPGNPEITDAGLIHFSRLMNLTGLDLSGTSITGSGLVHLGSLSQVGKLHLNETKLSDEGLAQLDPGSQIFTVHPLIDVSGTSISEVGLDHLIKYASPEFLFVSGTRTTPAGLAELRQRYGTTRLMKEARRLRWQPKKIDSSAPGSTDVPPSPEPRKCP